MGILDEALEVVEESTGRMEQTTQEAIAKQVKYLEDNASGDADGHWEFWSDGLYVTSLKEFKKFIKEGSVKGSIISDIISKVNPFMKKIKNMPDPKAVDKNLTYDSYSECEAIRQLEESFFNMFDKRTTRLGTDDAGKILADILKQIVEILTKWIAENSDLSEEQVGFRAAGVKNKVELALSTLDPILHSMAKNWYGERLSDVLTNATEDTVLQTVTQRMYTDIRTQISTDLPECYSTPHLLDVDSDFLPDWRSAANWDQYSSAATLDDCVAVIEDQIKSGAVEKAATLFGSRIDTINSKYSPENISNTIDFPADSGILRTMGDEIRRDLRVDDMKKYMHDYDSLREVLAHLNAFMDEIDTAIADTADKVDKLKPLISKLDDQINKLPQDLKEILNQTKQEVLFDATGVDTLTTLPTSLVDKINDYYRCE